MITAENMKRANAEGRQAEPGAANPYTGTYALARAWRLGYEAMLLDLLKKSPSMRAYRDAQKTKGSAD